MSSSAITLVVGVQNEASGPLAAVQQGIEQVGRQAVAAGGGLEKLSAQGKTLAAGLESGTSAAQRFVSEYGAAAKQFASLEGQMRRVGLAGGASVSAGELAGSSFTIKADTAAAEAALARVALPTESVHTLRVREVREAVSKYAAGGQVFQRLAAPQVTHGSGQEDDVPALLMRDEFVMRREAVAKYGLDLMYALNERRLEKESLRGFSGIPRFASGGAVSAAARKKAAGSGQSGVRITLQAPEYDPAQFFRAPDPMALLAGKVAFWSQSDVDAFVAERVNAAAKTLNMETMRGDPQASLNQILATYSSGVRAFATGGDVSGATLELERHKRLLTEEYTQKIASAKQLGNEDIAALWETQLLELEQLIAELQSALESMAQEYVNAVEQTANAYKEALAGVREQYGARMASLQQQLWLANKNMEVARGVNELQARASGESGSTKAQTAALNQARASVSALESEEKNAESATVGSYAAAFGKERGDLDRTAARETKNQERAGRTIELERGHAIRKIYLETLSQAQRLEIEWKKAVAALETQYTRTEISGFSHWLSGGGLATEGEVKPLRGCMALAASHPLTRLAAGGEVPFHAGGARGKDSVLAMLAPGEFVLNASAVENVGLGYLRYLNGLNARVNRSLAPVLGFAEGGAVPGGASLSALPAWSSLSGAVPSETHEVRITFNGAQATVQGSPSNARTLVKQLQQLKRSMAS